MNYVKNSYAKIVYARRTTAVTKVIRVVSMTPIAALRGSVSIAALVLEIAEPFGAAVPVPSATSAGDEPSVKEEPHVD